MLSCIDPCKRGDLSDKAVWKYGAIGRTMAKPAISNGLIVAADWLGKVHCLDATTGESHWVYDTTAIVSEAFLVADGKVYVGNEDGELHILAAAPKLKVLNKVKFPGSLHARIVAATGTLYVSNGTNLYAFAMPDQ